MEPAVIVLYPKDCPPSETGIFLETAHPAKFLETVEGIIGDKVEIPAKTASVYERNQNKVFRWKKTLKVSKGYLMKE